MGSAARWVCWRSASSPMAPRGRAGTAIGVGSYLGVAGQGVTGLLAAAGFNPIGPLRCRRRAWAWRHWRCSGSSRPGWFWRRRQSSCICCARGRCWCRLCLPRRPRAERRGPAGRHTGRRHRLNRAESGVFSPGGVTYRFPSWLWLRDGRASRHAGNRLLTLPLAGPAGMLYAGFHLASGVARPSRLQRHTDQRRVNRAGRTQVALNQVDRDHAL